MATTTIIIPTHNRPHLLPRAVESARAAGTDVEIIVVDDASQDETASVCSRLNGIKYIRLERNHGVAGARNIGLLASCGTYLTFLDDDDLRLPQSLDHQLKLLDADKEAGMIYGQAVCVDERGEAIQIYPQVCPQGDVFWELVVQNFIPCGSALFRRSCLERVGLLDDSLPGIDDWDLWIRIAELYPIIALEEPVMNWRQSTPTSGQGTSAAATIVSMSVMQYRKYWSKLPRVTNAPADVRRAAWRRFSTNMAAHLSWQTFRCLQHNNLRQARKNLSTLPLLGPLAPFRLAHEYSTNYIRQMAQDARKAPSSLGSALDGKL
jgi:glycosyltransferase involved in cell wall biosynthesis